MQMKWFQAGWALFGIGGLLFLPAAVQAAAPVIPRITTLEGQAAVSPVYLKSAAGLSVSGTYTRDGDIMTVWVEGSQEATVPDPVIANGGVFSCDFNSPAVNVLQALVIRADHLGAYTFSTALNFLVDTLAPDAPAIHWGNPVDNAWVGQQLNSIYADLSDTGGSGIDTANTTITVSGITGTQSFSGNRIIFTPTGAFTSQFVNNTLYTITVSVQDRAGNLTTGNASFRFDGSSPDNSGIHWTDPLDVIYAGPKLSRVWATVSDPGGSGINWTKSTLRVGAILYTNTHTVNTIDFVPTQGFPATVGHQFVHNTLYTVTADIYDAADNRTVTTRQFRCDLQAPIPAIYWRYPDRGNNPPSYYMGEGLTRIWGTINPTVTTTSGFDAIDYSNTATSISVVPAPASGARQVSPGVVEWAIVGTYHNSFTNGTLYTVQVTTTDMAGNVGVTSRQFMKDMTPPPSITDIRFSNPSLSLTGDNVVLRSSGFPRNPDFFSTSVTDNPSDWGGHTSLNANGITYHAQQPTDMRLVHESAGVVNSAPVFSGADTTYLGAITQPLSYTPLEGVYKVSVTARDWAHATTIPGLHESADSAWFLVDNTPPAETRVSPPDGSFYTTGGMAFLRSIDLQAYPGHVTVVARDTPADRGYNFGHRLDFTASTATLRNPNNAVRPITLLGWTQPGPVVSDLCNSLTASISASVYDAPIYPVPEYIGNTIEGRYTLSVHLQDRITASLGAPNVRDANYYFCVDVTPPRLQSWTPFSTVPLPDSYTSSFSDVQARVEDPDLRDGFAGSGLNLPASRVDLYLGITDSGHPTGIWSTASGAPGTGVISAAGPFTGPQGQSLNLETVSAFKIGYEVAAGRKIFMEESKHSAQVSGTGSIAITGLDPDANYVVGWKIPSTYTQDGTSVIGAVPNTPILKNGLYFANCFVADMVGNTAQVESINFNYLSAGGPVYLSVAPSVILADGVTTAVVTSSPIHLSENPSVVVQDGTQATVSSSLGEIITPDVNPILPGVQLRTSGGVITFTVRSRPSEYGRVTLRVKTVSGFADSGLVSDKLEIVLAKMENTRVEVDPVMERMTARYTLTGTINRINPLTANLDRLTLIFPSGTGMPATISSGVVRLNGAPISNVTVTGETLAFLVPQTLAAGSSFTLLIPEEAGVLNPGSGHYQLSIQSTQDMVADLMDYDIIMHISDHQVIAAPNPSRSGLVRFFFNVPGPARAELLILNLASDRISRVTQDYAAAQKGAALDWDCRKVAPGVYWAILKLTGGTGPDLTLEKKKVVIVQ